jgi:hypothetical protein
MADLTITVPDPAVPRIRAAVGRAMLLGRDATTAEVQTFIRSALKQAVIELERMRIASLPQEDAAALVEAEFGS